MSYDVNLNLHHEAWSMNNKMVSKIRVWTEQPSNITFTILRFYQAKYLN